MTNNEILWNVKKIFSLSEAQLLEICSLGDLDISFEKINQWLSKENHPDHLSCNDIELAAFLNGLICALRGQRDGPSPEPEKKVSNNTVLKKLKIALDLKNDNVIEIFASEGVLLNKYELTGFLRKPGHKNYRFLKDQHLKKFFNALERQELSLTEDTDA